MMFRSIVIAYQLLESTRGVEFIQLYSIFIILL